MNEFLLNKYNELIADKLPAKYYHLNTTYNLIFHWSTLEEGGKKDEMFKILNSYLDYIKENDISSAQQSIEVYNQYLRPVVFYYEKKVGFMYFVKWKILLLMIFLPSLLISFFLSSIYVIGIVFVVDMMIITYFCKKSKSNKTYGYMW